MTCAEFQHDLPEFIESGGKQEQMGHLNTCPICSDLVQDLKYIADAARLLVPMHDPSPTVWQGIEQSLRREGLLRPAGGPARLEPFLIPGAGRANFAKWMAAAAATVVVLALIAYNAIIRQPAPEAHNQFPAAVGSLDSNDEALLTEVADRSPAARSAYQQSMRSVNAYIRDAKKAADDDPDDTVAREHLMNAYEQKAALYEMASTSP